MSLVLAAEPTSLVAVEDQCSAVEQWAERCESVPELRDATNRLAAIDEYLSRTSTEGRARVAAAIRRIEVRIGELLPKAEDAPRSGRSSVTNDDLTRNQRHEFRQMAAHPETVEDVIAASTDEHPASRRQVMAAIRQTSAPAEGNPAETRQPYFAALRAIGQMERAAKGVNPKEAALANGGDRTDEAKARCERLIRWLTTFKEGL